MTSQNPFPAILWVADPKIITVQATSDPQRNDLGKLGTERNERGNAAPAQRDENYFSGGKKVFIAQQRQSHVLTQND